MPRTDWDAYYRRPFSLAQVTRKITAAYLERLLRKYVQTSLDNRSLTIAELGGANSCFAAGILKRFPVTRYVIVDNNKTGLALSEARFAKDPRVTCLERNILLSQADLDADIVFSVGLIEHFDPAGTAEMLARHFAFLRPGGLAVISYPTPTALYRTARRAAERSGKWIFHDERPLLKREVLEGISPHAELLESRLIWPILLTQEVVACQKRSKRRVRLSALRKNAFV